MLGKVGLISSLWISRRSKDLNFSRRDNLCPVKRKNLRSGASCGETRCLIQGNVYPELLKCVRVFSMSQIQSAGNFFAKKSGREESCFCSEYSTRSSGTPVWFPTVSKTQCKGLACALKARSCSSDSITGGHTEQR
ncbi:hypothetical protein OS493_021476 [Desmophyllum pertusum]|uniref:Uncharacterized protein n=1 Tax=Desmophyllum pertusum TaxID=174260 RepID=A0A9W9YYP4_9CNID|nr:hypothetical protein OS493_021476 [Desmophyllum pertusum]